MKQQFHFQLMEICLKPINKEEFMKRVSTENNMEIMEQHSDMPSLLLELKKIKIIKK